MEKYNVLGNEMPQRNLMFNKYCITLMNSERIYIYTLMNQIDIIYWLTKNKYKRFFDEFGYETTVFRKHIVKITEVK